ncbi:MAG: FAD-dependent monooxygenase [Pseudomonadales bacterium]|nr:FAD-dependent monooxygenase [Pseudomonadales bacterium]
MAEQSKHSADKSDQQFDIVVIGGGMAGLAFTAALADSAVSILVVDRLSQPAPSEWPESFDPRVSALSLASENLLKHVGAWPLMASQRVSPYQKMHVWDGEGTGQVDFANTEVETEHLGHIVENRVTQWALYQKVLNQENATFVTASLANLRQGIGGWQVTLDNGEQYHPDLLVGADGAQSQVRNKAGFQVRAWPYEHTAIVTTVKTSLPHEGVARQIFLETGPLAFLPLQGSVNSGDGTDQHYCSIVWSLQADTAQEIEALGDRDFKQRLGAAFEHSLGDIVETDLRYSFPLIQRHCTHYIQPGLALIGDAAHTIHPLAGQGINLGFLDAAVLAEEVASSVAKGLNPGQRLGLRRYERRRKSHNLLTMGAMEGFKRAFEPLNWLLTMARNEGMNQFNRHYLAKRQVVSHAMGLAGDLPKIVKNG